MSDKRSNEDDDPRDMKPESGGPESGGPDFGGADFGGQSGSGRRAEDAAEGLEQEVTPLMRSGANRPIDGDDMGSDDTPSDSADSNFGFWSMTLVPFRRALVRGLAVVLPPLLTIVLFVWAWKTLDSYVLEPIEGLARYAITLTIADIRRDSEIRERMETLPEDSDRLGEIDGRETYETSEGRKLIKIKKFWIPIEIYDLVETQPGPEEPITAAAYYDRYVQLRYLRREVVIPLFLIVFVVGLYLAGKTLAVGMGRMVWNYAESVVSRVPLIRNVYSSVKQVTDFAFTETKITCRRIVAIEYPRKGLWSLGFVTGEGMKDVRSAANEPVVTVLVPTSPMPATGFTITVPRSETIDLNITMDQAIQFCVSCGVVVPKLQMITPTVEGRTSGIGVKTAAIDLDGNFKPKKS